MKTILLSLACVSLLAYSLPAAETNTLKNQKEKVSYTMGFNLGNNWKSQEIDVDLDLIVQGVKDAQAGKQPVLTDTEMRETMNALQKEMRDKRQQRAEKNKKEGEAFLAENKTKPGIVTLPDGLQYKILTEGKGQSPKSNDTVTVNYRGTLIDGTEFDSSIKRGQPATFGVNRVIKGWTEALLLMKPGAKWQLFIPADLAYGPGGSGKIGPNSTLLFEVELISAQSAPPPPPMPAATSKTNEPVTSDIIRVPSAEALKKGEQIKIIKKEDIDKEIQKEKK
jgi:FKBP-type peptidyl-prolyl cis-trans isomerase FklB